MTDPAERAALALVGRLTDDSALRNMMKNAKLRSPEVHHAALLRLVEVSTAEHDDPVARACWRMVHIVEEVRREAGRPVWKMNRLRPKIARDGAVSALEYCAVHQTEGFGEVIGYGLVELTAEAIVLGFPQVFSADVLAIARDRLLGAGIDPTLYEREEQS